MFITEAHANKFSNVPCETKYFGKMLKLCKCIHFSVSTFVKTEKAPYICIVIKAGAQPRKGRKIKMTILISVLVIAAIFFGTMFSAMRHFENTPGTKLYESKKHRLATRKRNQK